MKKVFIAVVMGLFVAGLAGQAFAMGTKSDAEAVVKKTVAFIKANGKEKAFAEINAGKLNNGGIYPVVLNDMTGMCLAHGTNAKLVGKNLLGLKDSDGTPFVQKMSEIAKTMGKGWMDYKFTNPESKKIEPKSAYIEKYEDLVVNAGTYNIK
jgi:signal transduction histidine kinase